MTSATRRALILSGGGAYGAFAIGILKVLAAGRCPSTRYEPLNADIYTGTSVGAFNAALMVSRSEQGTLEAALSLEDVWVNRVAEGPGRCGNGVFRVRGDPLVYFDVKCLRSPVSLAGELVTDTLATSRYILGRTANFLASSAPLANRAIQTLNLGSFIDPTPFHDLLRDVIHDDKIRQSPIDFRAIATNWITGSAVHFGNSDFQGEHGIKAIMASSALPGIFPPVIINTDLFVDGGVVDNTPLKPAIDLGATELHVVYLDPQPRFIPLNGQPSTIDTLIRVYYLMLAAKINQDIETARSINAAIAAIQQYEQAGQSSASEARDYLRVADRMLKSSGASYKRLVIHRYFPTAVLGGDTGMLDFRLNRIASIIEQAELSALVHDCTQNGCVLN